MPVQIEIPTRLNDTTITIFNNQQNQSFKFYIEGEPTDFIFDPNNFILDDAFIDDPRDLTIPENFELGQNYPNPFNSTTTIPFKTRRREKVILKIYDALGNEISEIFNKEVTAGEYEVSFGSETTGNASFLSSGVYIVRMFAGDFTASKKLILLK
jgi:hypothetical protein